MMPLWCMQKAVEQETAALRASQDLIAEEERQQAHAAAKKAKKERAKAKKQQSQQCPLPKPDTPMDSPGAIAVTAALQNGTDLSTASITSGVPTQPVASANTSLDVDPNSIKSATTCMGFSDQAEWRGGGRKDSVMPVQPTKIAGSHLVEPALTTKSSSMSPFMLEQRVLHLMLCPITQVQSLFSLV